MGVFGMSPGCTGIWLYALTRSILEKKQQSERRWNNSGCDGRDIGRGWFRR
jgi:hypothetical protein